MNSLEMLAHIAAGLGPLRDKVVFVGGSTVPLYLTDRGAGTVRPTEDVDCVTEAVTRRQHHAFEAKLEDLGFRHSMQPGAPICRWTYHGLTADIMPAAGEVLGFRNSWYADGCANSRKMSLPGGEVVRIFALPYFLASKIEAFLARGRGERIRSLLGAL